MPLLNGVDAIYKGTTRLDKGYLGGVMIPFPLRRYGHNAQHVKSETSMYAYSGIWGIYAPNNESMTYTVDQQVFPEIFPAKTTFNWNITQDPDYGGINGYVHIGYGNYDGSPVSITSRQLYTITALSLDVDWSWSGASTSGLLSECYLTDVIRQTGSLDGKTAEIGYLPKVSLSAQDWAEGLPLIGDFTDAGGTLWTVREALDGSGLIPYFAAFRPGYADHHGALDFTSYFAFLISKGKISGNEWFNGVAFGAEPHYGVGSFTVKSLLPTYSGSARAPWTISDLVATGQSTTSVLLTWSTAPGAASYEYRIDGGNWMTTSASTSHTVNGLSVATSYTFEVRGINATSGGNASNMATVTTAGTQALYPDMTIYPANNIYPVG